MDDIMFDSKRVLITGGTGSFGNMFIPLVLSRYDPEELIVYSRDEMKQWEMAQKFEDDKRVRFVIGDVRDKEQLSRAMIGIDYVVHAAATKIVPLAEYNPTECIKTNINGAINVIECSLNAGVKAVVALSTDKASNPINLYGATKLASDKLFIASNGTFGKAKSRFSVVRYGNVMGSRGSVIPFFMSKLKTGVIPITHPEMTRFMISLDEATDLVLRAFDDMLGGEIYVKKIPSMKVVDIANSLAPDVKQKIIGIRPGEKLHEQMIGIEDAPHTYEYNGFYKILPAIHNWSSDPERIGTGQKVREDFSYTSDNNLEWMTSSELTSWVKSNNDTIGRI
jgi:UDP-N-acetylglucosamine 4,6-dehydratase/5-epimerase